jgi:hypothetical protein
MTNFETNTTSDDNSTLQLSNRIRPTKVDTSDDSTSISFIDNVRGRRTIVAEVHPDCPIVEDNLTIPENNRVSTTDIFTIEDERPGVITIKSQLTDCAGCILKNDGLCPGIIGSVYRDNS